MITRKGAPVVGSAFWVVDRDVDVAEKAAQDDQLNATAVKNEAAHNFPLLSLGRFIVLLIFQIMKLPPMGNFFVAKRKKKT